jgi:hypothetical protein
MSALGADESAQSHYHRSKKLADDFLSGLPLDWVIVQPSLVYGPGGTSARLFDMVASLPLIPLPEHGQQLVQPIYIDDLVEAVQALVEDGGSLRRRVPLVGPCAISLRGFLIQLRAGMGMSKAMFLSVPIRVVRIAARALALTNCLLEPETLDMLMRGNTSDSPATQHILKRVPRSVSQFISSHDKSAVYARAKLSWLLPMLRLSVASVWIVTGIISLGIYPISSSYVLLARAGVPSALAPLALYGAALLDLTFGFAALASRRPRALWLVQMGVIIGYSLIISIRLPEFWLHPYGPMIKNVPLMVAIWILYEFEPRQWNT